MLWRSDIRSLRFLQRLVSVALLAVVCCSTSVQAQPAAPPVPPLPPDFGRQTITLDNQPHSLPDFLKQIAAQSHHAILADDTPLRDQAGLEMTDATGSLKEILDRVATAFDYAWSVNNDGVILLHKKFSKPEERPQINRLELAQVTKEALGVLDALAQTGDLDTVKAAMTRSFTPEQRQKLRAHVDLSGDDLLPVQRDLLLLWFAQSAFRRPRLAWETLRAQLDGWPNAALQAHLVLPESADGSVAYDTNGKPLYPPILVAGMPDWCGYYYSIRSKSGLIRQEWSLATNSAVVNAPPRGTQEQEDDVAGQPPEEIVISRAKIRHEDDDPRLTKPISLTVGVTTLADLLRLLPAQAAITVRPAPYLAEHGLIACGDGLNSKQLLNALSELGGWMWTREAPGHWLLSRPQQPTPRTPADITLILRALLPADWRTYFGISDHPGQRINFNAFGTAGRDLNWTRRQAQTLFQAVQTAKLGDPAVPVAGLSAQQQRALLTILAFQALIKNGEMMSGPTKFLTQGLPKEINLSARQDGSIMLRASIVQGNAFLMMTMNVTTLDELEAKP